MNLHEFKELDFEEAVDLLETRLIGLKEDIEKLEKYRDGRDATIRAKAEKELDLLHQHSADIEERLLKLKAAELAGEKDNLLSETFLIFDQAGERVERFLEKTLGTS